MSNQIQGISGYLARILGCSLICISLSITAVSAKPTEQFLSISPLPGGGVAIDADGAADGEGALQFNIPVAYTPKAGRITQTGAYGGCAGESMNNGSAIIGMGLGTEKNRVYLSAMVAGEAGDAPALNGQYMLTRKSKEGAPVVSVGIQNAFDAENLGSSTYIVATQSLPKVGGLHATLGVGNGRFEHAVFGGLSLPVGEHLNIATEWDGYQLNNGVAWRPYGRNGKWTVLYAYNGDLGSTIGVSSTVR